MCDHCGCRELPPIGELMDEHDRIMELAWQMVTAPDASDADGSSTRAELRVLLEMHARKEERALYPLLIDSGDMAPTSREAFEREHRELLDLVDAGRFTSQDSNVLTSHIQAEELELFPSAMFAFEDGAWERMEQVSHDLFHEYGLAHDHGHHGR